MLICFSKENEWLFVTHAHVIEPQYPPAVDRYVNLGHFYDIAAAKEAREEAIACTTACSRAYQQAYRALGAARQMADSAAVLAAEGLDREKLMRRADGIIGREIRGHGSGSREDYRFLGSVTCCGPVWRFDAVETLCPKIYQLQDSYSLAWPLLERLRAAAGARGFRAIVCPAPDHPERIEHLLLPELGTAFVTSREGMAYTGPAYRRVRVDAMVSSSQYKRHKSRLRFIRRMETSLRQEGIEALREAKRCHDALEAVYRPYVDFDGVEELTNRELVRMEGYL